MSERFLSKNESKRLLKKLEMKYGVELQAITAQMAQDKMIHGFVLPETEAKQLNMIERIKEEERGYKW